MLKLLFCKVADVFNRDHRFLFTATVQITQSGEAVLMFPLTMPVEEMAIEGYVTFFDDVEGLVTYWCSFFNLRRLPGSEVAAMNLSLADMVEQVQRRQDLKTAIRFKMEVDYTDHKGRMRFCQGEVENISAGGVFFTSEHKFQLGDSVVLRLSEITPRLFAKTHILRIQALDDWVSSPWLIRQEEKPAPPPKPPVPEGQNIFSFVKRRKEAKAEAKLLKEEEEAAESEEAKEPEGPPPRKMAFEVEEEEDLPTTRVVEEDRGGETIRYGYGCQFKKIGEANEIAIRRFVFEQERLRLQTTR